MEEEKEVVAPLLGGGQVMVHLIKEAETEEVGPLLGGGMVLSPAARGQTPGSPRVGTFSDLEIKVLRRGGIHRDAPEEAQFLVSWGWDLPV